MNIHALKDLPPWEWPPNAGKIILPVLRDDRADSSDRLVAAELAGDSTVIDDALAGALLSIVGGAHESEELRSTAAIALGPILEQADIDLFDDPDGLPISEKTFSGIQKSFRKLYMDTGVPKNVRRRILEASVRAPQDWHPDAIRAAYSGNDALWKLTAVFCMRYVRGFDAQILESLESKDADLFYEAVCAAGSWGVEEAWPHIAPLIASKHTEKPLLLAAIEAVAGIRPEEASDILDHLRDSEDEDILDAVNEAVALSGNILGSDEDEDDYDKTFH
jgi:hypothetical protein